MPVKRLKRNTDLADVKLQYSCVYSELPKIGEILLQGPWVVYVTAANCVVTIVILPRSTYLGK
jgi:hypothetical protein